jgi:hypothetical protein
MIEIEEGLVLAGPKNGGDRLLREDGTRTRSSRQEIM